MKESCRILLSGCNGTMGRAVGVCIDTRDDCEIVAGVDLHGASTGRYPVLASPGDFQGCADVIVDFSHPAALDGLLAYALTSRTPAVLATTGLSDAQVEKIRTVSTEIPVFFSANMSLGVNLMVELCKKAASVLYDGFDIEIIEAHHNKKIDAPSGTAHMLADAVTEAIPEPRMFEYDRHIRRTKRDKKEIGIHSIRGGTIVGDHEVLFAGHNEVLRIAHSAGSKEIFAIGAVKAALFLAGQPAGLYSMADLLARV